MRKGCLFAGLGFVAAVAAALVLGVVALRTTFTSARMAGVNMAPTLEKGDIVLMRPPRSIRRGDIIAFTMPGGGRALQRVIGMPGDTIELRGGRAVVNGLALDEPYVLLQEGPDPQIPVIRDMDGFQVPPDSFFVLGDNRDHANDSRFLGPVARAGIHARAVAIVSRTRGIIRL